ncbi:hypothetical protein POVCU2_0060880 [Plasmodium ovale curtisi]|uniref:PIR Superfamily Protein n=1 Tax=Plasmodium ovale curtisi TaxID=864141 RepID=A0A1A8XCK4_PLAOA|nr:hypothetical protein POVCU2_0060880 [Plasmodium ovale curtisi]SBT02942.1 hypothetical protein POVCU1_082430 [Plasmodium ovale curtisi]
MSIHNHDKLINTDLCKCYNIFDRVCNNTLDTTNLCNSDDTYKCVHISLRDLYKKVLSNLRRISNREPVFTDKIPKDYYKVSTCNHDSTFKNCNEFNDYIKNYMKVDDRSSISCEEQEILKDLSFSSGLRSGVL